MDVLSAFRAETAKCDCVCVVVEEMHFSLSHFSDHEDFVAADLMAGDWYVKLEDTVDDYLSAMET